MLSRIVAFLVIACLVPAVVLADNYQDYAPCSYNNQCSSHICSDKDNLCLPTINRLEGSECKITAQCAPGLVCKKPFRITTDDLSCEKPFGPAELQQVCHRTNVVFGISVASAMLVGILCTIGAMLAYNYQQKRQQNMTNAGPRQFPNSARPEYQPILSGGDGISDKA